MLTYHFPERYDLRSTFDCGQIFRFETFDNGKTYYGPLGDRFIKIWQESDIHEVYVDASENRNLKPLMDHFLRVDDDYLEMQQAISIDEIMKKVVPAISGLHLLRQSLLECTVSFFLSQCSNIPTIKLHLGELARLYGTSLEFDHHHFYLFPTMEKLRELTNDDLRALKFGYRAEYIYDYVQSEPACFDDTPKNSEELNCALQNLNGIGPKVADCIQLLGFGDLGVFPVDVWIKRFMEKYYFSGVKTSEKIIRNKGADLFGKWAGYANQFIYHYARKFEPAPERKPPNRKKTAIKK